MSVLDNLNEPQFQAVTSRNKSILVIAGAGAGKTKTLISRIAYLIQERGVSPHNILALTFTRKTANEMKERLGKLLDSSTVSKLWVGTFHSISLRILEQYGSRLGYHPNISVYDEVDQADIITTIIKELGLKVKPKDVVAEMDGYASDCDNHEFEQEIAQVVNIYRQQLKSFNAVDFTLLLTETLQLIRDNQDVYQQLHDKFKYVFTDEHQDTNWTQFYLHEALKPDNIFSVGDARQLIYSWRGSQIEIIEHFADHHPGAEIIHLDQCYRCPANVIDMANNLIRHNNQKDLTDLWTNNEEGRTSQETFINQESEAECVASVCKDWKTHYSNESIAILTRTHNTHKLISDVLNKHEVENKIIGTELSYWKTTGAKMVTSILIFLHNRKDTYHFRRVARAVIFNFSEGDWLNMEAEALKLGKRLIPMILEKHPTEFNKFLTWYDENKELPVSEVVRQLLDVVQIGEYFWQRDLFTKERQLREISTHLKAWEDVNENDTRLPAFLEYLADQDVQSEIADSDNCVKIMTIHAAKGLEFSVVFVANMNEGTLPHRRSIKEESVEEERRICYVAITRTKGCLFLSSTKTEMSGNRSIKVEPSRFIKEMFEQVTV